jgi:hypothetical protein
VSIQDDEVGLLAFRVNTIAGVVGGYMKERALQAENLALPASPASVLPMPALVAKQDLGQYVMATHKVLDIKNVKLLLTPLRTRSPILVVVDSNHKRL